MTRKIQLMHDLYGTTPGRRCGECCSFVSGRYYGRILRKCERYGLTHSEATDWAKSWEACGMLGVPMPEGERPVIEWKGSRAVRESVPVDGQMGVGL